MDRSGIGLTERVNFFALVSMVCSGRSPKSEDLYVLLLLDAGDLCAYLAPSLQGFFIVTKPGINIGKPFAHSAQYDS